MTIDTALAERVDDLARQYAATRSWTIGWLLRAALEPADTGRAMSGSGLPPVPPVAALSRSSAAF